MDEGKTASFGGNVQGTGKVEKTGKGTLQWNSTLFAAAAGLTIKEGTVLWDATSVSTNGLLIDKNGILQIGTSSSKKSGDFTVNNKLVTGGGTIKLYANGGKDSADGIDLKLGNGFSGIIDIAEGVLNLKNSEVGRAQIRLDGTGIQTGDAYDLKMTFANNVIVGDKGGFIKSWGSNTLTMAGKITGNGTLTQMDSGHVIYTGDMSEFNGAFVLESNATKFDVKVSFEMASKIHLKSYDQNPQAGSTYAAGTTVFFRNEVDIDDFVNIRLGKAEFDMANKGGAGVGESTIGGKLLMGKASVFLKSGVLSIAGGIEVDGSQQNTLTLEGGAGLYLGGSGIALKSGADWSKVKIDLGSGSFGSAASWGLAANMNLMSATGTTFDTMAHTMTLNGVLSGSGKLIKSGSGTLILNANNQFSGGIELANGVLQLKQAEAVLVTNDLTMKGSSATLKLETSGEMTLNNLALTQGTLSFGNITKLILNGSVSSTEGSLALSDGMMLVMKGADNKLGTLASAGAGVTLDYGASTLVLGVLTQSDYDHLTFVGNGVVSITSAGTSALKVNKTGLTAYYYAGMGG